MRSFLSVVAAGCGAQAKGPTGTAETADTGGWAEAAPWDAACDPLAALADEERASLGASGASFAVVVGGSVICATGLGDTEVGGSAVGAETLFRIGQLTETLSAAAALQQVADHRLDLDEVLPTYVEDFSSGFEPGDAATITVAALLNQTAALTDIAELNADPRDEALAEFLLHRYAPIRWLNAPAGRIWNPSAPNTATVGLLIERAEGRYYREAMAGRLFGPLGMDRTLFLADEVEAAGNVALAAEEYDNGWARPSAYAWSSAWDLGRFAALLLAGDEELLDEDLRGSLLRSHIDTGLYLDRVGYGYGAFVLDGFADAEGRWFEQTLVAQAGDMPGFSADLVLLPEAGVGVVALVNGDDAHLDRTLDLALETFGDLPEASEMPDPEIDPADFLRWQGTWIDEHTAGAVILGVEDEALTVEIPLFDMAGFDYESRPTPLARGVFAWSLDGEEAVLSVLEDADGEPAWLRTRAFVAAPEEEAAAWVAAGASGELVPSGRSDPSRRALRWVLGGG